MFMVTGITGRVGGAVARHLLARGATVRALVRDRHSATTWGDRGVELVEGDWNDPVAVAAALKDADGAFAMLPTTYAPGPDCTEARRLIGTYVDAFALSAPRRLVALSSIGADRDEGIGMITPLHLMERSFRSLPFPVAFVRAGAFLENFLHGLETGREGILPLFYPANNEDPVPMVASDDIGLCVADILVGPVWQGVRTIELGTPTTAGELAEGLGTALGREVTPSALPRRDWAAALQAIGVEPGRTEQAEQMFDAVNAGWIAFGVPGAERVDGSTDATTFFTRALAAEPHVAR